MSLRYTTHSVQCLDLVHESLKWGRVQRLIYSGEGKLIFFCHLVKWLKVHTEPLVIFHLFWDHENRLSPEDRGRLNNSSLLHFWQDFVRESLPQKSLFTVGQPLTIFLLYFSHC